MSEKGKLHLEPVAHQVASIARSYGYIDIIAFPDVDSAVAASIVLKVLSSQGASGRIRFAPIPPRVLEEPTLLLGYPVEVLDMVEFRRSGALVARGAPPRGLTKVPVAADASSSVSGLTTAMLMEITAVGEAAVWSVAAAYWRLLDRGKRGEFIGVEEQVVEALSLENKVIGEMAVRLFEWFKLPTEEAIARTLNPYYPGLSGSVDAARRMLEEDPRLRSLIGVKVMSGDKDSIAVLVNKLYELLKSKSRVQRRPSEVIGYAYYTEVLPLSDLREAAYQLYSLAQDRGLHYLAALAGATVQVAVVALHSYASAFKAAVDALNAVSTGELSVSEVKVSSLKLAAAPLEGAPLGIIEQQLRLLGYVPLDAPLMDSSGDYVLLESLLAARGLPWIARSIESGCLKPLEGDEWFSPLAVVDRVRCRE